MLCILHMRLRASRPAHPPSPGRSADRTRSSRVQSTRLRVHGRQSDGVECDSSSRGACLPDCRFRDSSDPVRHVRLAQRVSSTDLCELT